MTVYNADKTQLLTEYDLTKGWLMSDTITRHVNAIQGQEEQGFFDQSNGGEYVVTQEYIKAVEEHDEDIPVMIYMPYTEAELQARANAEEKANIRAEILENESYLTSTDYMVIKCLERGLDMKTEYAEAYEKRQIARDRINELRSAL